jgi:hypothetical protein
MLRQDFIKTIGQACLAGGCLLSVNRDGLEAQSAAVDRAEPAKSFDQRFKEAWIVSLMGNMEKSLDEKTRVKLMEACGRMCAQRGGLFKTAAAYKGRLAEFVRVMAAEFGPDLVSLDGNTVNWGYGRCMCELVAAGPERLPDTYCHCSVGWVKEIFELVAQRPVAVKLLQSVKRGAGCCKFVIAV